MKTRTGWRSWATVLLGTYLFFAPWIFGTSEDVESSANAWIVGFWVVVVALLALVIPRFRAVEGGKVGLACWLLLSPFVLDFQSLVAAWNVWIVGTLLVATVGIVRLALGVVVPLRGMSLRYQIRRLSPEKIVGYESPEEEPTSPERLSWQVVEHSERLHRATLKEPSGVEAEMCVLGYQACMNDLITLICLVNKELPKSGPIRRARLKLARRRATDSLARVRRDLP